MNAIVKVAASWSAGMMSSLVVVLSLVGSAHADFKVCNKTTKDVYYEHVISDNTCSTATKSRAQGWWFLSPNQCKTVNTGSMNNRDFAYYAESADLTTIWNGGGGLNRGVTYASFNECGALFCINCPSSPDSRVLSHRSKTGTATNYTLNLLP